MRIWPDVIKNIYWLISDGRLVNSWNDTWIRKIGPLKPFFEGIGQSDEALRVCDMIDAEDKWDWCRLISLLPNHVLSHITTILLPCTKAGTDRVSWK